MDILGKGHRLALIYNPRAGSAQAGLPARLLTRLGVQGATVLALPVRNPEQMRAALDRCLADRLDAVFGFGGDGTQRALAARLCDSGIPLGPLPGGTFNYFVRNLGLPPTPLEALDAICAGAPRSVSVGEVNGHLFLNNASFGLYRSVIEERERHKAKLGRSRAVALFSALLTLLRAHPMYHVEVVAGERRHTIESPMLFFGCNALQLARLSPRLAQCAAKGELAVLALHRLRRADVVALGARALTGTVDGAAQVEMLCADSLEVMRAGHTVRCALDGEVRKLLLPLRVRLRKDALRVLAPASS